MKSPTQIREIYDRIKRRGGFQVVEEKTGLTRGEVLRVVRDGETAENVEKVAHAIGLSVAELIGKK